MSVATTDSICAAVDGLLFQSTDNGGVLDITTPTVNARVALQGAQILNWQPTGHADVFWRSTQPNAGAGLAMRGGIPLCWPWFSRHPTDPTKPQHGFARNAVWQLTAAQRTDDSVSLTLSLPPAISQQHGLETEASAQFTLHIGTTLEAQLVTLNHGPGVLNLTAALHTYFAVGDIGAIVIDGLDGATFRDNTDAGRTKTHTGALRIASEIIALFDEAPARTSVTDPILQRRIDIVRVGGASTVVWNPGATARTFIDIQPGAEKYFVCVESGLIGSSVTTLAPGERHSVGVSYSLSHL
jgi:glucose-6-phosphate 1-epimerase